MCRVSQKIKSGLPLVVAPMLTAFRLLRRRLLCVFSWISVLSNSKQEALSVALDGGREGGGGCENSVEDLTRAITDDIRRLPGNSSCCDCGAPGDPSLPSAPRQGETRRKGTAVNSLSLSLQILDGSRPTLAS